MVKITDNNFLNALIEQGVDTDGDGQISHAEAEVVISLDVGSDSISDMTGIEKFISLETLECDGNQFTTLDVSNNTALTWLECEGNQLTTLDVSNNTALRTLGCAYNQLATLDISNNTALFRLYCGRNQLTTLDVSHNIDLERLYLDDMASIGKVCVWEMPFPPTGAEVDTTNSPNVYFTTDCN